MPTRKDLLRDLTHKDQFDDDEHRIYHVLLGEGKLRTEQMQLHRLFKITTSLIVHLQNKKLLTDKELDDILLQAAQ